MKKLLKKEETILIRAVYQFVIDNYQSRPYFPGLMRLMIKFLALRGEWKLLQYLSSRALHGRPKQEEYLPNRDAAALVNYAISISMKLKKGTKEVVECIFSFLNANGVDGSVSICERGETRVCCS